MFVHLLFLSILCIHVEALVSGVKGQTRLQPPAMSKKGFGRVDVNLDEKEGILSRRRSLAKRIAPVVASLTFMLQPIRPAVARTQTAPSRSSRRASRLSRSRRKVCILSYHL